MLHQMTKKPAPATRVPVLPSWDPFYELRRLFKQNALLAIEDEDTSEQNEVETKPLPRKASAEA